MNVSNPITSKHSRLVLPLRHFSVLLLVLMFFFVQEQQGFARQSERPVPSTNIPAQEVSPNVRTVNTLPYFDDMENGEGDWTYDGFHHLVENPSDFEVLQPVIFPTLVELPDNGGLPSAHSGIGCWWYGEEATGTFIGSDFNPDQDSLSGGTSTGPNSGSLISPYIDLRDVTDATLEFFTWWEIEGVDVDRYDMMYVDITVDSGETFVPLGNGSLNPLEDVDGEPWKPYSSGGLGNAGVWLQQRFDLSQYTGEVVNIRFRFQTNDDLFNGFRGWFIDDFYVYADSAPAPEITEITPAVGRPSDIIELHGENFQNGATVTLDSIITSAVISTNLALMSVPDIPVGTYDIQITNPDSQSFLVEQGFTVSENINPEVTSITPDNALIGEQKLVYISGHNFEFSATAIVGGIPLDSIVVADNTLITGVTSESLPVGFHNVKVQNPSGLHDRLIGAFQVHQNYGTAYFSLTESLGYPGDTVTVEVMVDSLQDVSFSSAELSLSWDANNLEFLGGRTNSSLLIEFGWDHELNVQENMVEIWAAGANDMAESGLFIQLDFAITGNSDSWAPVEFNSAVINTGLESVATNNGGVQIELPPIHYGDVDLNSLVQGYDALYLLEAIMMDEPNLNTQQELNANVSLDQTISALDASLILLFDMGLLEELPVTNAGTAYAASGNLSMNGLEVEPGQSFTLPIDLSGGSNIFAYKGGVSFNDDIFSLDSVSWNGRFSSYRIEENNQLGVLKFAAAGTTAVNGTGTFNELHLSVSPAASIGQTEVITIENIRWNEESVITDIDTAQIVIDDQVGLSGQGKGNIPVEFSLSQNYPNPFNPATTIKYGLPENSFVNLSIFDASGHLITNLVSEEQSAGWHTIQWNGQNSIGQRISTGVYFYRIEVDKFVDVRKMVFMK